MFYAFLGSEVAAISDSNINEPPNGFNGWYQSDLEAEEIYWQDNKLKQKPPKPSTTAYWNTTTCTWEEPPALIRPTPPNWQAMLAYLQNPANSIARKAYTAAENDSAINLAWTGIALVISSTHSLNSLAFYMGKMLPIFTSAEKAELLAKLQDWNFPSQITDLF